MFSGFSIPLLSGSTWYGKEEEEIRIKKAIRRLSINKAESSGFWGRKLKTLIASQCRNGKFGSKGYWGSTVCLILLSSQKIISMLSR